MTTKTLQTEVKTRLRKCSNRILYVAIQRLRLEAKYLLKSIETREGHLAHARQQELFGPYCLRTHRHDQVTFFRSEITRLKLRLQIYEKLLNEYNPITSSS